jgi:hypothetical protein
MKREFSWQLRAEQIVFLYRKCMAAAVDRSRGDLAAKYSNEL